MPGRAKPLRIVVTGREGQVARALAERGKTGSVHEIIHAARPAFDMEKPENLAATITALEPDLVINAAAYTAVDKAEQEAERAMAVNAAAAGEIARGARDAGAPVIQISTDYVFDGSLDRPYREDDDVSPLGVYGRTKLAGEIAAADANPCHVILRTAWVYSPFGRNFVKTMLGLAETKSEIGVVADQMGNPTSAFVVADAALAVADLFAQKSDSVVLTGTYHVAGNGAANWHEFARAIFEIAAPKLPSVPDVRAITTADYPTPARRPANSRLDTTLFEQHFGYRPPDWRVSLKETLERLL